MAETRPSWKRSSKSKQAKKSASIKPAKPRDERSDEDGHVVPLELQQDCLDIFHDALRPDPGDAAVLQEVKGHLYNRDFAAAFGQLEHLRVYASRWSASRGLGYLQLLQEVSSHVLSEGPNTPTESRPRPLEVVCLGGGAGAEVVALAGWLSTVPALDRSPLHVRLVDVAAWSAVVESLHERCLTARTLSKYASAAAREANEPMVAAQDFSCSFHQQDVLDWPDDALQSIVTPTTKLAMLFFTLNELYSTSVPRTQHLLSRLTVAMPPGSFLLVVDSPGSYSTVTLNGADKKYPMQWLLDHTMLKPPREAGIGVAAKWEKVVSNQSIWYRLPQGLQYPIELENMRYQMHLYRRLAGIANQ
ncbi:hypothetical protein LTR53_009627 [Teratosphaeriaceae sp. CCFEE 6253]|nr:hypothetical protein LTR53_009627 [Teratosphaeriaceae sp. CCFEE 6253]